MRRRKTMLLAALLAMLSAAAGMAWSSLAEAKRMALGALADTADVARCAEQIESCRRRPALASDHQRLDFEVASIVERAAVAAGVDKKRVARVAGETPQRFLDTVYKEKPTQVFLRDVTLRQVTDLAHGILAEGSGLHIKNLQIRASGAEDAGDLWSAELMLTYLIYDPQQVEK
jgi:hypothetical protein